MTVQAGAQIMKSPCGQCVIIVENDMPVGKYHDFLLERKGHAVDIMVNAQKQDTVLAEQQKNLDSCNPTESCSG